MLDLVPVRSAVDVGCGDGSWLQLLRQLGVDDVVGVDGPWALRRLKIDRSTFVPLDLHSPLGLDRRFDLAISLEVAEHLPGEVTSRFVQQLTDLAPVVLFSAAVPGQGGTGHVNEQWPDYWAACFAEHRYVMVDALRPRFWDDATIEPWYAQNAFLFASAEACAASPALATAADECPLLPPAGRAPRHARPPGEQRQPRRGAGRRRPRDRRAAAGPATRPGARSPAPTTRSC